MNYATTGKTVTLEMGPEQHRTILLMAGYVLAMSVQHGFQQFTDLFRPVALELVGTAPVTTPAEEIPEVKTEVFAPGTRIEKCNSTPRDKHPDGATGVVVATFEDDPPELETLRQDLAIPPGVPRYMIEWDDAPGHGFSLGGHLVRRSA